MMTVAVGTNVVLARGGVTVTVATEIDEENWTKSLVVLTYPTTPQNQGDSYSKSTTKILDLLQKPEERVTVDGYLATGIGASDTSNAASDKKTDLKNMFFAGGVVTMTYEGSSITVGLEKCSVKRLNTEGIAAEDGVPEYSVKFTCVKGEDLV